MRIAFFEVTPHYWTSAASLLREAGGNAVLWLSTPGESSAYANAIRRTNVGCDYLNRVNLSRGDFGSSPVAVSNYVLGRRERDYLRSHEATAFRMMSRLSGPGGEPRYGERIRAYYRVATGLAALLRSSRAETVCFQEVPHMLADYVLYLIARLMGLRVFILSRTWSPWWSIPSSSIEGPDRLVHAAFARRLDRYISPRAEALVHLDRLRNSDNASAEVDEMRGLSVSESRAPASPSSQRSPRTGSKVLRPLEVSMYRQLWTPLEKSHPSPLTVSAYRRYHEMRFRRTRQWYKSRSTVPPAGMRYVLFPLHYQPEATTLPLGGPFDDLGAVISLLRAGIPDGWGIAVKEHPATFVPGRQGFLSRNRRMYEQWIASEGVVLVPHDSDTRSLLNGAEAVATVTGTVGWEALALGVPVMAFGAAWYRSGPGVHNVAEVSDVTDAVAHPCPPAPGELEQYASALIDVARPIYSLARIAAQIGIDESNGAELFAAICKHSGSDAGQ